MLLKLVWAKNHWPSGAAHSSPGLLPVPGTGCGVALQASAKHSIIVLD